MLTSLSQQDKRWNATHLGNTSYTIGRYGCTTTSLSMATQYFHTVAPQVTYKLPPSVAKSLTFNAQGYIVWSSLSSIGLKLKNRFYGRQDATIQEALRNPLTVCLLNVNHGAHWVLTTGKSLLGGYNVLDPWDGKSKTTRSFSDITGGAVITIS